MAYRILSDQKLKKALVNLRDDMYEVISAFDGISQKDEEIFAEGYPFFFSFDEMVARVDEWVEGITGYNPKQK